MPKVSVIVPVYNAEKYIEQCLESIVNQTLKDTEIITINDGSQDRSLDIMERLAKKHKNKIKIITQDNNGPGSARNKGLEIATGEYIKFVDADDYLKLDILERMYKIAKDNNVSLVRGNYKTIVGPLKLKDFHSWSNIKGTQIVDVRDNKDYIVTETPGVGNKLIKRELIGNLRFAEQTKWEDLAIMPVIIAKSEKVFHLEEPVYNYRMHMNTTITDEFKKYPSILDIIKVLDSLEKEMKIISLDKMYHDQLESLYIIHILYRIENAMSWVNLSKKRKKIIVSSFINILDLKYPNWKQNELINKYKDFNFLFKLNMNRITNYTEGYIKEDNIEVIKDNIKKVLKK